MAAIDNLSATDIQNLEDAKEMVTHDLINKLDYGKEIILNDSFRLYHYIEEEIIVIVFTDIWEQILQVMSDDGEITFEVL
tara:strand:+ start:697 stop:936 length:240 start_codon:yes stop_codon:yes gene_type:complete